MNWKRSENKTGQEVTAQMAGGNRKKFYAKSILHNRFYIESETMTALLRLLLALKAQAAANTRVIGDRLYIVIEAGSFDKALERLIKVVERMDAKTATRNASQEA